MNKIEEAVAAIDAHRAEIEDLLFDLIREFTTGALYSKVPVSQMLKHDQFTEWVKRLHEKIGYCDITVQREDSVRYIAQSFAKYNVIKAYEK